MNIQLPEHINPKAKTAVYIDAANMFYSQKTINFRINYEKLYTFFDSTFNIRTISYYTGYDPKNKNQLKFLAKLEIFGYRVISKPVKQINSKDKRIDKANVDVELAIDTILEHDSYKNFIIASGDSDFGYLLQVLKQKKKDIIVLSARGHISKELRQLSDLFIPIEKLRSKISV
ncbi:MAG TPA: NYN domain-containing protein [Candidatus Woesebacteria bacterium]|nr:NYN domain-containing protein [Candidatus Woesebacteria bacterium]